MFAAFRVPRRVPLHQRLVVGLLAFQVVLVLAYVIYASVDSSSANRGADFFDLDRRATFLSWFVSAQLLAIAIAIVMWGVAFLQRADDRPSRISLVLLGAFFTHFSIDESLVIHGRIKRYVGGGGDTAYG